MDGIRTLMKGGSHGNGATLEPQLSPMLWTSIATGKMAYHRGVEGMAQVRAISLFTAPTGTASAAARLSIVRCPAHARTCAVPAVPLSSPARFAGKDY